MDKLQEIVQDQLRTDYPNFNAGDKIKSIELTKKWKQINSME